MRLLYQRLLLGGLAALAAVALALPASAAVGPGDLAPDFEGNDYFNTEPLTLRDLRGKLVFLELFSVT